MGLALAAGLGGLSRCGGPGLLSLGGGRAKTGARRDLWLARGRPPPEDDIRENFMPGKKLLSIPPLSPLSLPLYGKFVKLAPGSESGRGEGKKGHL